MEESGSEAVDVGIRERGWKREKEEAATGSHGGN